MAEQTAIDFTAISTRNKAFGEITFEELGSRQQAVLDVIGKFPEGIHNAAIARILHLGINQVTPRTHELRQLGLVDSAGTALDPLTKRTVTLWRAP